MSGAIGLIGMGVIIGVIASLGFGCLFSRKTDPASDIERRGMRGCRRKRLHTSSKVDEIFGQYRAGALTYSQAVHRMRAHETPSGIAERVLGKPSFHH